MSDVTVVNIQMCGGCKLSKEELHNTSLFPIESTMQNS